MKLLKKAYRFLKYGDKKWLTIKIIFYTAIYRFLILTMKAERLEKRIGIRGEQSEPTETEDNLRKAYWIGKRVCRIADHTPWESKCLVRSLTARKLLNEAKIPSTLYLGVGKEDDKMIAHSWLRCGELYVTGGNGANYATVATFLCK